MHGTSHTTDTNIVCVSSGRRHKVDELVSRLNAEILEHLRRYHGDRDGRVDTVD